MAGIDPQWIFQLAPHCCKLTHQNPHWSAGAGNVLVEEIVTLHGLEVRRRKVAYGNINSRDATTIFIRSALVEENLMPSRNRRGDEAEADRDEVRILTSVAVEKPELPPAISLPGPQPERPREDRELAHARPPSCLGRSG